MLMAPMANMATATAGLNKPPSMRWKALDQDWINFTANAKEYRNDTETWLEAGSTRDVAFGTVKSDIGKVVRRRPNKG